MPAAAETVTTVSGGLDIPWDVGFLPDHTMLFTERGGGLNAVVNGQRRLLWKPADLLVAIESGMMSLAVDPTFGFFNNDVFVCFASNLGRQQRPHRAARASTPGITTVVSRTDILTGVPMNPEGELGRHSGCRLRFGPDGYLWVGTGDAAMGAAPQNPWLLAGKVLRIDKNGAPAPGNMGPPFDPRIESYGHRNVQGIAFRSNGQAFAVEHGTGCDDEVNLLTTGANYGWDPVPRAPGDPDYDENTPMTDLVRHPGRGPRRSGARAARRSRRPAGVFVYGSQWGAVERRAGARGAQGLAAADAPALRRRPAPASRSRCHARRPRPAAHRACRARRRAYVTTSNGSGTDAILRVAAARLTSPVRSANLARMSEPRREVDRDIHHDVEEINAVTLLTADMHAAVALLRDARLRSRVRRRRPRRSRRSGPGAASSTCSSTRPTPRSPRSGAG